jgi:hypothetical protein
MPPDTPCKCYGDHVGLSSLSGIFKAGCLAGLITANHMWGAEWGFAALLGFSRKGLASHLQAGCGGQGRLGSPEGLTLPLEGPSVHARQ